MADVLRSASENGRNRGGARPVSTGRARVVGRLQPARVDGANSAARRQPVFHRQSVDAQRHCRLRPARSGLLPQVPTPNRAPCSLTVTRIMASLGRCCRGVAPDRRGDFSDQVGLAVENNNFPLVMTWPPPKLAASRPFFVTDLMISCDRGRRSSSRCWSAGGGRRIRGGRCTVTGTTSARVERVPGGSRFRMPSSIRTVRCCAGCLRHEPAVDEGRRCHRTGRIIGRCAESRTALAVEVPRLRPTAVAAGRAKAGAQQLRSSRRLARPGGG